MKNPPILISILGFFAALAGFGFLFFGLRVLGFDWFGVLGDLPNYEPVGLWGWLAIATGIVWLLAAGGLWALQPWARLFAMIIAGFALFEAVLAFFQFPGTGIGFGMAIMPALILWYLSTDEVTEAFGRSGSAADRLTDAACEPARRTDENLHILPQAWKRREPFTHRGAVPSTSPTLGASGPPAVDRPIRVLIGEWRTGARDIRRAAPPRPDGVFATRPPPRS